MVTVINLKTALSILFKGLCIGGSMTVPGVSGGSMAMVLGIYENLISAINKIRKKFKESALFLGVFCVGSVGGIILLSGLIEGLLESYPFYLRCFFIGAIAGGLPLMFKHAGIKKFKISQPLYAIVGGALVLSLTLIPPDFMHTDELRGVFLWLVLIVAGIFASIALILPGISVSHILLVMGLYIPIMNAINIFRPGVTGSEIADALSLLVPFVIGLVGGIFLITRPLEFAMNKFPQPTYMIIIGFIIGSVYTLIASKEYPMPALSSLIVWEFIFGAFLFIVGGGLVYALSKAAK
jgi:putative membrane protein